MLAGGTLRSLILWGPPGTGKTTIARLLAAEAGLEFVPLSALGTPVAELRKIFETAAARKHDGFGTLLFMDEIHRYNRAQQDQFLPYVENGTVTLVGATTENPSFALNGALLSRAQVLVLNRLNAEALGGILQRAETELGITLPLADAARDYVVNIADGDGRYLLTLVEQLAVLKPYKTYTIDDLEKILQRRAALHDRDREGHYNLLSALHKTIRGSDVNAALFYLARLFAGGEDPRVIARRLTRAASEDIGMADPQALVQCLAAWEAFERLGSPEGELAIVQAVIYLATAPKSNAAYVAHKRMMRAAENAGSITPPKVILNAPTAMMKEHDYGDGYEYDHDTAEGFSGQNYWPAEVSPQRFYEPVERGFERDVRARLAYWAKLKEQKAR
jgi:putative ATPase